MRKTLQSPLFRKWVGLAIALPALPNLTARRWLLLLPAVLPMISGQVQAQAIKNVLQPSDPIVANSANSPASEGVKNAIDGTTAKYLNFDGATGPSGFVVTPQVGSTLVSGLGLETANDSPNRDPAIVTIEGSNDPGAGYNANTTWTLIYSNSVDAVTNRYFSRNFYFSNSLAFTSYRWTAVTCAGPGQNSMQVAEVQLLGNTVPLNLLQPSDPIVANSANSPASEGVKNAIDGTTAKYLNFDGATGPSGFVVTPQIGATVALGLGLETANDSPNRDPAIVTIEGSNDPGAGYNANTTWTLIYSNSVPAITNRYFSRNFYFPNETPYTSYRWTAVTCAGPGQNSMQIAEVQILGVSAPVNILQPSDPIAANSANSPASEGVKNAIDGTTAKYLNFDGATGPSGFVVTPGAGATTITGLGLETANDSPNRDPAIVTIEGSNDSGAGYNANTTWTLIYSNSVPAITNRYFFRDFYFPNNIGYTSYRWTAVTCAGPGQNSMQVAEVQLLAVTTKADCTKAAFVSTPVDTPALAGSAAEFFVTANGPWPLQWYVNGAAVPGATKATFSTDPLSTSVATNLYSVAIMGCQTSPPVHAVLFTPSTTTSIGIQFSGGGANGTPEYMNTNDIAGVQQQAFWNVVTNNSANTGSTGDGSSSSDFLVDSSGSSNAITFQYTTSARWGAGVTLESPTGRLLDGIAGSASSAADQVLTFHNVPTGTTNALLIYAVSPPLQFQTVSYTVTNGVNQTYYVRVMNSDEYKPAPGFYRATSTSSNSPSVADFIRFDGVTPDANGDVNLIYNTRVGAAQATGVNAVQLVLSAPNPGAPPVVTANPPPTVAAVGGTATLTVAATGTSLTYQWRLNGRNLSNGGEFSGVNTATLTINPFSAADAGVYSVAVFSPAGSVVSGNAAVAVTTYNIQQGVVDYWKFDETAGTNAANSATNGLPASVYGTASWGAGKVANAFTFDGSTSYMFVSNYTKPLTAMAVSAWVNIPTTGAGTAFTIARNADGGLANTDGQFSFGFGVDPTTSNPLLTVSIVIGADVKTLTAPSPISPGTWHQVAFTADGAQLRLFVDGQQVASLDYLGTISSTPATVPWLSIGASLATDTTQTPPVIGLSGTPDPLNGSLDELAIWQRALTASEVSAIYNAGLNAKGLTTVVETPPVGGATLKASISNGQITVTFGSGTLQGAPSPIGPWTNITTTGSSFTEAVAPGAKFYRTH